MALSLIIRQSHKLQTAAKLSSNVLINSGSRVGTISKFYSGALPTTIIKTKSLLNSETTSKVAHQIPKRLMSANHSVLWTVEKVVSAALLGLIPATFISPSPFLDNILALTLCAHTHWGIEAIVVDYVRPIIFGNVIPKVALVGVYVLSGTILGGLLYFNHNDIGIGQAGRKIWAIAKH